MATSIAAAFAGRSGCRQYCCPARRRRFRRGCAARCRSCAECACYLPMISVRLTPNREESSSRTITFTARDHPPVDHDIDRIADLLVERDDGTASQLHQAGNRHGRAAENHLHIHRNAHDEIKIGLGSTFCALRGFSSRSSSMASFSSCCMFLSLVSALHACPASSTVAFLTARRTKTGSAFLSAGSGCSAADGAFSRRGGGVSAKMRLAHIARERLAQPVQFLDRLVHFTAHALRFGSGRQAGAGVGRGL